jgi:hypothetical protein
MSGQQSTAGIDLKVASLHDYQHFKQSLDNT